MTNNTENKGRYNKTLLTDVKIRGITSVTKQKKVSDSLGLYLLVHPNGSKYWRMKYKMYGKEKLYSIGSYPQVSLSEAREARDAARKLIKANIDPTQEKDRLKRQRELETNNTFEKIALDWHKHKTKYDWKENNSREILSAMKRDLFPFLGKMPVKDINTQVLKKVLKRVENRGALELVRKQKQWCYNIFNLAIEDGYCTINPATTITLPKRVKKNFNCIELNEFPQLIKDINNYDGDLIIKYGLQLIMITALRTEELRPALWEEIDFKNKLWTIPAQRLKWWRKFKDVDKIHIVPLSKQAINILNKLKEINGHTPFIFASPVKPMIQSMSNNAMLYTLYRLGYHHKMTVHSFRSLFSTICNTVGKNKDHVEAALAHSLESTVHGTYNKSTYLDQRVHIMQWYADHLDRLVKTPEVISIDSKKKLTS